MGFAENVFNKVRGTPSFKPASIDSFGNWAIEAGDVITVENDGVTESIPIFSADMSWDGSAQTTMSCTGNQKREILDKQTRREFATSNGLYGYASKKAEELADSFGVELGNVRSALDVYVKDTEDYKEANTALVASIEDNVSALDLRVTSVKEEFDGKVSSIETAQNSLTARVTGAEASLKLKASQSEVDGISSSVATLKADVITLQGNTEILGNLSITDGRLRVSKSIRAEGSVLAQKFFSDSTEMTFYGGKTLSVTTDAAITSAGFTFAQKTFKPTDLTLIDGTTKSVLGYTA